MNLYATLTLLTESTGIKIKTTKGKHGTETSEVYSEYYTIRQANGSGGCNCCFIVLFP